MAELEKNALLSVFKKDGIVEFAGGLRELGWNIFASGGTHKEIVKAGIEAEDIARIAGGEAILGHRVVTISRPLHAGLLARLNEADDLKELESRGLPTIGLVGVDMYPLAQAIAEQRSVEDILEMTDIGGPLMLRSAAKGRRIVLSRQDQRQPVLNWLDAGMPDEQNVRLTLAAVAEQEVTSYVAQSAQHLAGLVLGQEAQSEYDAILRQGLASAA